MSGGLRWTQDEYDQFMRDRQQYVEPVGQAIAMRRDEVFRRPAPDRFLELLASAGLPPPAREIEFIPGRDFRADYLWPNPLKIIVEQHGYADHHSRAKLRRDYEKCNLAQAHGYKIFQFTPKQLAQAETIEFLRPFLAAGVK